MPDLPLIPIGPDLLSGDMRNRLETELLPAYLPRRRWFAAKDQRIEGVRIASAAALPGAEALLTEIEVRLARGPEHYLLPLAVVWDEASSLSQQLAVAQVRQGSRTGLLTDAFTLDRFVRAVLAGLRRGDRVGELVFERLSPPRDGAITWLSAEQSNSSLLVGEAAVMKLLRRLVVGIHPEVEMTGRLTEAGFAHAPPLLGEVARLAADGTRRTLMLVQGFVHNQGDAWGWTLERLSRDAEDYETVIGAIGLRLGQMHAALAQPVADPAFAPERADEAVVAGWIGAVRGQLSTALDILARRSAWVAESDARAAASVLGNGDRLLGLVQRLARAGLDSPVTRIHGDFHLGQVLVSGDDAVIIDFEGEPARSLAERRAKSSPARDVAGLLRSLDYAAAVARRSGCGSAAALTRFRERAAAAFRTGYGPGASGDLTTLFTIDKAAYEIRYEAANRPDWITVPLHGLAQLADDLLGPAT